MHVEPGTRLGPYEILSRIGAGGMGEVFRARDTRLDRSVAVKILSPNLTANPQLQLRFEREAKAISQLNHPNICTLHDIGHDSGTSYLVMELLEGETLADRIGRGTLPLADVIRFGSQIAEALDRAHRAGIVHRDVKPANVMLTKSGAKLLDFGLARAGVIDVALDGPTQQKPLTAEGAILGTFQYMAPEQLEGAEADARTDIFALGTVLYEMATGQRAFQGKTKTSLIAAIVTAQPSPISNVQPLAPSALDHVIAKCLEKERDDRWQSAHDVAEELKWIGTGAAAGQTEAPSHAGRWVWPLLILLTLASVTAFTLFLRERNRPRDPVAFSIMPPRGFTFLDHMAISPDGRTIANCAKDAAGEHSIWTRRVGAVESIRITPKGSVVRPEKLFWSPDGRFIGFFDQEQLMKIDAQGGRPEMICKGAGYGVGASWGTQGTIVFAPHFGEGLFRVPDSGGEPARLMALDLRARETLHGWPQFLEDGEHFLFLLHTIAERKNQIYAGSVDGKLKKLITTADSLIGVWRNQLLVVRDGAIYSQPFDQRALQLSGQPRKVADDVAYWEDAANSRASVARDGALAYFPASNSQTRVDIDWYDRNGRTLNRMFSEMSVNAIRLNADESAAVMMRFDPKKGANDVYTYDFERGITTRLTGGLSNHQTAVWSPAGDQIFFSSDRDGMYDIYVQPEDGASPARPLWKGVEDKHVLDVSPDGKDLLISLFDPASRDDIWVLPTAGGTPRRLVSTSGSDNAARFSPDGRWIVYSSDRSGREEVFLRPFPDGRSIQVSIDGGKGGEWSASGKEIYYAGKDRNLVAVPVSRNGASAEPGKPTVLFPLSPEVIYWTIGPRGDHILIGRVADPAESIVVANYLSGWQGTTR